MVNERRAESLREESQEPRPVGWGEGNMLYRKIKSGRELGRWPQQHILTMCSSYDVILTFPLIWEGF